MRVIRWIRNGFFAVLGIGIVAYLGACVWANWVAGDGKIKPPAQEKAGYAVQLMSTGQILFSDKVEDRGTVVTLKGYYEYDGRKFLFRKNTLTMDERYFGEIKVSKRQVAQ